MNRFEFIQKLLDHGKMTARQKERFLKLASEEIGKVKPSNEELWEEIEAIKDRLGIQSTENKTPVFFGPDGEEIFEEDIPDDAGFNIGDLLTNEKMEELGTQSNLMNEPQLEYTKKSHTKVNLALETYKSPNILRDFLIAYNQNGILKYTCHLVDGDALENINNYCKTKKYDFQKHKQLIKNTFYELTKDYDIDKNIHGKIGEYLNDFIQNPDKKGWSEDKILVNWSVDGLKKWCNQNPGKCPNPDPILNYTGYEFSPIELKSGDTLNSFSDVVLHFKKQIQFRASYSLYSCLQRINYQYRDTATFDVSEVQKNIELFTDTEKVLQAYIKLLRMSIDYHNEVSPSTLPSFKLSFTEEKIAGQRRVLFKLHHTNSVFGKTVENLKERLGEKMHGLIKSQLNGVCDLTITADFANGEYHEMRIWPGPTESIQSLEGFTGVCFNLKF